MGKRKIQPQSDIAVAPESTNKVILFQFKTTADIYELDDSDNQETLRRTDFHYSNGLYVGLVAGVFEEQVITHSSGIKKYRYTAIPSSIPKPLSDRRDELAGEAYSREKYRIEWTEEWEKFFASTGTTLADIALKLAAVERQVAAKHIPETPAVTL